MFGIVDTKPGCFGCPNFQVVDVDSKESFTWAQSCSGWRPRPDLGFFEHEDVAAKVAARAQVSESSRVKSLEDCVGYQVEVISDKGGELRFKDIRGAEWAARWISVDAFSVGEMPRNLTPRGEAPAFKGVTRYKKNGSSAAIGGYIAVERRSYDKKA